MKFTWTNDKHFDRYECKEHYAFFYMSNGSFFFRNKYIGQLSKNTVEVADACLAKIIDSAASFEEMKYRVETDDSLYTEEMCIETLAGEFSLSYSCMVYADEYNLHKQLRLVLIDNHGADCEGGGQFGTFALLYKGSVAAIVTKSYDSICVEEWFDIEIFTELKNIMTSLCTPNKVTIANKEESLYWFNTTNPDD